MPVWIRLFAAFAAVLLAEQLAHARDPDGRYTNSPSTDGSNSWQARRGDVARTLMACPYRMSIGYHTTVTIASRSVVNGSMYPMMPS
jgi:hypothetical protein